MPDPDIRDGELDQFSHALRKLSDSLFGYTDSNGKEHTGAYDQAQAEYNKALAEYETTKAACDKKRATQIPDDVHKGRAAYDDTELTEAHKKAEKAKEAYDDLAAIRNETNNSERRKAGRAETYLLDFNYDKKYERTSAIASSDKALPTMAPGTVDNVVTFGSPGSGVRNIDAYGLPEGHVYESSIPDGDAVQGLGPDASYGTNPRKLEGITHLSADATDAANYWTPTPPSIAGAAGGHRTRDSRLRQPHGVLRRGHAHLAGLRQHHRRRQANNRRGVGGPQEGAQQPPAADRRRVAVVEAGAHRILAPTLTHSEQLFALHLA